jgi:hypothetical protein
MKPRWPPVVNSLLQRCREGGHCLRRELRPERVCVLFAILPRHQHQPVRPQDHGTDGRALTLRHGLRSQCAHHPGGATAWLRFGVKQAHQPRQCTSTTTR